MLHLAGYIGLSILEKHQPVAVVESRPIELEWMTLPPLTPSEEPDDPAQPNPPDPAPEPVVAEAPSLQPQPVPEPPEEETPEETPEAAERPPLPEQSTHAVIQRSADPTVEPPPDAQYIAAENQRVEEETQAEQAVIGGEATLAPPPPDGEPAEGAEPTEEASAEPTEGEAEAVESEQVVETPPAPPQPPERTAAAAASRAALSAASSAPPASPTSVEMETVPFEDESGTFSYERPRPSSRTSDPRESAGGTASRRHPVDLSLRFSAVEQDYGPEFAAARAERRAEREALAAASGIRRETRTAQYHFAAQNFLSTVRTGNQTALNAAASPFAEWIHAAHDRIHRRFAMEFLPNLSNSDPQLSNPELFAEIEFVIDQRGRVVRVAIVDTSGVSAFDIGALNAILDAQPLPVPPDAIHSGDGYVYVIWGFSRGPSQCHMMQSRPYVLPNPPPLVPMPGVTLEPQRRPARFAAEGDDGSPSAPSTPTVMGRGPRRR